MPWRRILRPSVAVPLLLSGVLCSPAWATPERAMLESTEETPLVVLPETQQLRIYGLIYPTRFNTAQGDEARYHLLTWGGGRSKDALIETPADDLQFYEALIALSAQPGDNLSMAAWTRRSDPDSAVSHEKAQGSKLDVSIAWQGNVAGVSDLSIDQVFRPPQIPNPQPPFLWHFGGNRDRWFNRIPLMPRPGCLVCLYSCPSGKVSNGSLSIADYMARPHRFSAKTELLPPDGTPVTLTFRVRP